VKAPMVLGVRMVFQGLLVGSGDGCDWFQHGRWE
jgi:hypothetical protein